MLIILALATTGFVSNSRFMSEYPTEVAALRVDFVGVSGTAKLLKLSQGKVSSSNIVRYSVGNDCEKYSFTNPKSRLINLGIVFCHNKTKYFQLEKRGDKSPYTITSLGDDMESRATFDAVFGKFLHAGWAISNQEISSLMKLGRFQIVSEREFDEAGRDLVEVVFRTGDDVEKSLSCKVTFDPGLRWAIIRSESTAHGRILEQFSITYGRSASGRLFATKVRSIDIAQRETICEFSPVEVGPIPESEFTLECYGLNDPLRKPQAAPQLSIIAGLFFTSIIFLVCGRWLYRRSSRTN